MNPIAIPLWGKRGTGKHVLISPEDFAAHGHYHWKIQKSNGYVCRQIINQATGSRSITVYLHKEILKVAKGFQVDHKDRDKLNCTRENLRQATSTQNSGNRSKRKGCQSQYKGVKKWRRKWQAKIQVDRVEHYLGLYPTQIEAARAYDRAAREHFGEFANCNFEIEQ